MHIICCAPGADTSEGRDSARKLLSGAVPSAAAVGTGARAVLMLRPLLTFSQRNLRQDQVIGVHCMA